MPKLLYLESSKLTVLCHISQGYIHNTVLTKLEKSTVPFRKIFLNCCNLNINANSITVQLSDILHE